MTTLLLEKAEDGADLIHAPAQGGDDRTLCGYAYEGECGPGGSGAVQEIEAGIVNCRTCLAIIRHARAFPRSMLPRAGARVSAARRQKEPAK